MATDLWGVRKVDGEEVVVWAEECRLLSGEHILIPCFVSKSFRNLRQGFVENNHRFEFETEDGQTIVLPVGAVLKLKRQIAT